MKNKTKKNIRKGQAACLLAGAVLAAASALFGGTKDLCREGETVTILRPGYGEEDREQTVRVNGENISFTVSGRKYTEEEAETILSRLAEVLSSSKDPEQRISYDGYEGVRAEWSEGENGSSCRLTVRTERGIREKVLFFPGILRAAPFEKETTFAEKAGELLALADAATVTGERIVLPRELDGVSLNYGEKKDPAPAMLLLLGGTAALLLGKRPAEEEKKRKKQRETELLLDYSDVVSRLLIYLGAGLTVPNAFARLSAGAEGSGRAVFREIGAAVRDMENGVPEGEALSAFAKRCGPPCYVRLASLLERNQKTGGNSVRNELEREMQEAFAGRKEAARRMGEEAGTRLLLPLLLSLSAVLLVTAVPAFLKMNG